MSIVLKRMGQDRTDRYAAHPKMGLLSFQQPTFQAKQLESTGNISPNASLYLKHTALALLQVRHLKCRLFEMTVTPSYEICRVVTASETENPPHSTL